MHVHARITNVHYLRFNGWVCCFIRRVREWVQGFFDRRALSLDAGLVKFWSSIAILSRFFTVCKPDLLGHRHWSTKIWWIGPLETNGTISSGARTTLSLVLHRWYNRLLKRWGWSIKLFSFRSDSSTIVLHTLHLSHLVFFLLLNWSVLQESVFSRLTSRWSYSLVSFTSCGLTIIGWRGAFWSLGLLLLLSVKGDFRL